VLDALSRALQLDDAERAHLFDLVRAQQPVSRTRRRRGATQTIRPGVQRLLDRIDAPAYVRNGRLDVLAMALRLLASWTATPDHEFAGELGESA
jgi:hypothetical protein